MPIEEIIKHAYYNAKNYPDLVTKLIAAGIDSYTVEVSTGTVLYRLADGITHLHVNEQELLAIAYTFSEIATVQAIRDNQQGKTNYPEFMQGIAHAGVRFYEATLTGPNKRVTYIGKGGFYEEMIPA